MSNYMNLEGKEQRAKIHSLNGEFDTVKVITAKDCNNIIVEYKGKKCTAILNGFVGCLFVDDKYGIIE